MATDSGTRKRRGRKRAAAPVGKPVRLKPADPFELIRWLARSQDDPRKAVAELVQNALDAGARTVRIHRRRHQSLPVLIVRDDGEGVIPNREREEALRYIASNIGHSRKLGLTPQERRDKVVAGQYGLGLLGFWSVGRYLHLRSRVGGSRVFTLCLTEDSPKAEITEEAAAVDDPPTFTEVVVSDVHETAVRLLGGRKLTDYLAIELRGQILQHGAAITIDDRLGRGPGQRHFEVVPPQFVGEPLRLPTQVEVPGYSALRLELFFTRGAERPALQVACAGTLVADDIRELGSLALDHPPWTGCSITGVLDFADFRVPPGTRRGVMPDAAAVAFVRALEGLAPLVEREIERLASERADAEGRDVVRQLRKALKGLQRRLPQYELPAVKQAGGGLGGDGAGDGDGIGADGDAEGVGAASEAVVTAELFPPGPLAAVQIQPPLLCVPAGGQRRARAVATNDPDGRVMRDGVTFSWNVTGADLTLMGGGSRPAVAAGPNALLGRAGAVTVEATCEDVRVTAEAGVEVVPEDEPLDGDLGIPEPELVDDPNGRWRSRMQGDRWQVNEAHPDFIALRADGGGRLRYLLSLLAKEIVNRSFGQPGSEVLLERLVEILAYAERNLRGR